MSKLTPDFCDAVNTSSSAFCIWLAGTPASPSMRVNLSSDDVRSDPVSRFRFNTVFDRSSSGLPVRPVRCESVAIASDAFPKSTGTSLTTLRNESLSLSSCAPVAPVFVWMLSYAPSKSDPNL